MGDLSLNFSTKEMACACCGVAKMDPDFIIALQKLRTAYGISLSVTSGYRCPKHNKAIGGSIRSKHMEGIAADILVSGMAERYRIIQLAYECGFTGIGIAKSFVHLDIRKDSPVIWMY